MASSNSRTLSLSLLTSTRQLRSTLIPRNAASPQELHGSRLQRAFLLTATLLISACAAHGPAASHAHIDNNPCTWPYASLNEKAHRAIYLDEQGNEVQEELIATDSSMNNTPGSNPLDPHPHYYVKGRCIVELTNPGNVCGGSTPYSCCAGNQCWCSKFHC
jgi:hypothetical protein